MAEPIHLYRCDQCNRVIAELREGKMVLNRSPDKEQHRVQCGEPAPPQIDGPGENWLAGAQDAVDCLKSLLSLVRAGYTAKEATEILGFIDGF